MNVQTIEVSIPTAQKNHVCEWCGEEIPIGETHFKWTGKCDGEFVQWRMHSECYRAIQRERKEADWWDGSFESHAHDKGKTLSEMEKKTRS